VAIKVLPGPKLAERTTLRLGGRARAELFLESPEDAAGLGEALAGQAGSPFMLGWGSNLLALDHELDLAVVSLSGKAQPEAVGQAEDGRQIVRVSGGCLLTKLIKWAGERGLAGLEGLSGIPGTVGGVVACNAGSFGVQTVELLSRVRLWTRQGLDWIGPQAWKAAYRSFEPLNISGPWLVVEAELILNISDPAAVKTRSAEVLARKKASQPLDAASCGCAFKNPAGDSAGRLLDQCGFKGRSLGGMAFSAKHANFLVNEGHGCAAAALELIDKARAEVKKRYGVELELEVRVVR
jgi:UDP-N-acetylmuramate dehydrogenase